jgi:hypothetical protein
MTITTKRTEGIVETVDTPERRRSFEQQLELARGDRLKLLELRAAVEQEHADSKRLLTRSEGIARSRRTYLPPDMYALMADNVRVLGARILAVQRGLTEIKEQIRREYRADRGVASETASLFEDLVIPAEFIGESGQSPTDPLRVEACVSGVEPPEKDGSRIRPVVTLWDDSPPPMGGGFFQFTIQQARHLGHALLRAADHAQRAADEAQRNGWELVD